MTGPNDNGFDVFFGVAFTQAEALQALISNRLVTQIPTLESDKGVLKAKDYEPWQAMVESTKEALDFIDSNTKTRPDQPFFLYFARSVIHMPLVPQHRVF